MGSRGRGRPPAVRGLRSAYPRTRTTHHHSASPGDGAGAGGGGVAAGSRARVRLAGREVVLSALRRSPGAYRALFEQAKVMQGCGWCLCTAPAPRLVIRHRAGIYYLACWPGGGSEHTQGCEFHNDGAAWSGRGQYQRGALDEATDGSASVALSVPLRLRTDTATPSSTSRGGIDSGGVGRSRMSLLGLLHYLWDRAGLTRCDEQSRDRRPGWAGVSPRLQAATDGVSSAGLDLGESCFVVPPFDPADPDRHQGAFAAFTGRLGEHAGTVRRGLVCGAVRSWTPTRYGQRCELRHHREPVYFSEALHARVARAAPVAMAATRPPGSEQIVLVLVTRTERGYLAAAAAAVMLTTAGFVPAESSHEVVMADALSAAGRSFVKPLRYDATTPVLPDFVLTDTDPHTVVEVWGMGEREDYTTRKRDKIAHYHREAIPLIEWDTRHPLPALHHPGRGSS
ncbi:DUF1173 family protein [Pseudonocardia sp. NPDC049635]|uniref:DUF1173 family protein n=1 Tax=Pseudonocardia sp. NPDC049635 TaxID=3155506 RepID=UPI00341122F0